MTDWKKKCAELEADAWEQTECARKALAELVALKDVTSRRIEQEVAADIDLLAKLFAAQSAAQAMIGIAELNAELAELKTQVTFKDKAIDGVHAELAELKARRCGTCEHEAEAVSRACGWGVSVWPDDYNEDFDEPPADFACNRWAAK